MKAPARILVVDDHGIIRSGLQALLMGQTDMAVVGEASGGREAVALAEVLRPDVIVMDLSMPGMNGVDATREAVARVPEVKVVGLTAQDNATLAAEFLKAGAVGYVRKEAAFEELLVAIREALEGRIYCSREVMQRFAEMARDGGGGGAFEALTARERELLQWIAEGETTKEIAARMDVSVKTVETHRRNLMMKLNLHSVADLTKYAIREGLSSL